MKAFLYSLPILFSSWLNAEETAHDKHLFILSGQSNMARFQHEQFFKPELHTKLGAENTIVIKVAKGGQPISKWHKEWKSTQGEQAEKQGEIYHQMIEMVQEQTKGISIQSVTFIFMQGEADAKAKEADVYLQGLNGLKRQLEEDLKRKDIRFIIGRLSDSGFFKKGTIPRENPQWAKIREVQETFVASNPHAHLINTDDLNGEKNQLHYLKPEGYKKLGERYVQAALKGLD